MATTGRPNVHGSECTRHRWIANEDGSFYCTRCGEISEFDDELSPEQEKVDLPLTNSPSEEIKVNYRDSKVRYFKLGDGYDVGPMQEEFQDYTAILLGKHPAPIAHGAMTLMELAEGYHARAKAVEMHLHSLEADGIVTRGSRLYKFRTGFLRSFIELAAKSIELGSRRVTYSVTMLKEGG